MITVIIPTYNRGDIVCRTIPKYLVDPRVSSIVVVDDGSTDDTSEVIAALQQADARIRYLRNERRQGSVIARNRGLGEVRTPYFLMTDDDTYPDSDFFPVLLAAMDDGGRDIVAVRKVFLNERGDEQLAKRNGSRISPVNYDRLSFQFNTLRAGNTTTVPGTYFAKQVVAANVRYDVSYQGSAWREETDFGLTAHLRGFNIYFEPKAVVFELAKTDHRGGQWERPLATYVASAIRNNWYFLKKFEQPLRRENLLRTAIWRLQGRFILATSMFFLIVPAKQLLGPRGVMLGRKILGRTP